jgi:hypothetical protein
MDVQYLRDQREAWILRRREGGAYLPEPVRMGGTPAPFELLVVEVADQGKRRPSKVARLYAPGSKAITAELSSIKLVWLKGFEFVLQGFEVYAGERGPLHAAQSWLCQLDPPVNIVGYRMRPMFERGAPLPYRQVMDQLASATEGKITIGSTIDEALGRAAIVAKFGNPYKHTATLLDCELDWMGEDRLQLSGFQQQPLWIAVGRRFVRAEWYQPNLERRRFFFG